MGVANNVIITQLVYNSNKCFFFFKPHFITFYHRIKVFRCLIHVLCLYGGYSLCCKTPDIGYDDKWKNTQQIKVLPRRGAHMSFDYKPGSGNINSSDTVVGLFGFRWEESETDGFNLICFGQGFATWQIVSHLLPLWARNRPEHSAAHSLFMEAVHYFKPKLMMSLSWMFSVCWPCNPIAQRLRTQTQGHEGASKIIMWILVLIEPIGRIWIITSGFSLSPIILLTGPAVITTQIDRWRSSTLKPDVLLILVKFLASYHIDHGK